MGSSNSIAATSNAVKNVDEQDTDALKELDDHCEFIDRTRSKVVIDPHQTARALSLIDQTIADFDQLFDHGFYRLGKSQNDLVRQVQQVVFLRGTLRLHSALRYLFFRKTQSFFHSQLSRIVRGEIADWAQIFNAHRQKLATMKPSRRLQATIPFSVILSNPGNGKVFNVVFDYLSLPDKSSLSCASTQLMSLVNTRLDWRAVSVLAWIGSSYLQWYDSHMEVLIETLRYLDQQHSLRTKSHIEFLDNGHRAIKLKIDEVLPVSDDERAYLRQQIFGQTLTSKQRLQFLLGKTNFSQILTDHFIKFAKYTL